MTEEEKKILETPKKRRDVYTMWGLLIVITIFVSIIFTGGIAFGVQSIVGGGEVEEGVFVDGVRKFEISAEQWGYAPAVLKVNPGEKISFTVTSKDIMHGFSINELGVNLALSPDVGVIYQAVIPQNMLPGTYTMYCSIFCGIGHPYMKGSILIGDPSFELGKFLPYIATTIMAGMFVGFIVIGRRKSK